MYFVYILKSLSTGVFYKGLTSDIPKRIDQHMAGQVSSTKAILPMQLVHVEICKDRQEARRIEKFFKSGFGREIINELFR